MLAQEPEPLQPIGQLAIKAWNFLSNGMGGLDAGAMPFVAEWLGIDDPELLAEALLCIRMHNAQRAAADRQPEDSDEDD